ncbi:MAG: helix-turn-helix transcriptional regulator [Nitrospirae bacterium]|nr:helix-turn-helix transcriptional regulator [Nitrospirota bacterium]
MTYKEIIDFLLSQKGWSASELARRLNKDPSVISQWRNGYRNPGRKALKEIASIFGVTMDDIEKARETGKIETSLPAFQCTGEVDNQEENNDKIMLAMLKEMEIKSPQQLNKFMKGYITSKADDKMLIKIIKLMTQEEGDKNRKD